MERARTTTAFLNLGHALDHLVMLIFPTVVLAMTAEFGASYQALIPLMLGGTLAFGAGSLPAGWLGDRWGRRPMMAVFFFGTGIACCLTALAREPWQIAAALTLIGLFAAIYHPVGIAMLVKDQARTGRALGWNGLWGNLGVALAALSAGFAAQHLGWRWAYLLPGLFLLATGVAFLKLVPRQPAPASLAAGGRSRVVHDALARRVFLIATATTICGGIIFNGATIAMPKLFAERLPDLVQTTTGVGTLVAVVYAVAALSQLLVGRLIDGRSLRQVYLPLALIQLPLLLLAGFLANWGMLGVMVAMMFVVFGLIPINDAMVARYAHDAWRSRVYAVRYVVSFGASSLAVPLVAALPPAAGGFVALFAVLGVLGLGTLACALLFPSEDAPLPALAAAE